MHEEPSADTPAIVPEVSVPPKQLVSFKEIFIGSFKDVSRRLPLVGAVLVAFIGITLIAILGMALLSGAFFNGWFFAALSPLMFVPLGIALAVFIVLLIVGYIAAGIAVVRAAFHREEGTGYWTHVSWALRHVWPIFVISFLIQLVTSTGYLLLIIPGIALAFYTMFGSFTYVAEGRKGMSALLRSIDLIYGRFWGVLWRMAAFSFLVMLGLVIPMVLFGVLSGVLPMVGIPLMALFIAGAYPFIIVWIVFGVVRLYESAASLKPADTFSKEKYKHLRTILIIMAILGVPITIGWNMLSLLAG